MRAIRALDRYAMLVFSAVCPVLLFSSHPAFSQSNQTESFTIITYYPAPRGTYKNPQLFPSVRPGAGIGDACLEHQIGVMYFNETQDAVLLCKGPSPATWQPLASGAGDDQFWNKTDDILHPKNASYSVGIGPGDVKLYRGSTNSFVDPGGVVLMVNGSIARDGAVLEGPYNATQVNLGMVNVPTPSMTAGIGSTVCGGDGTRALGNYSIVGGGCCSYAVGDYVTIAGGGENRVLRPYGTVTGGAGHTIISGDYATIVGGSHNNVEGTAPYPGDYSTILGGASNSVGCNYAVSAGNRNNAAACSSAIAGGSGNNITRTGKYSVILGGGNNKIEGKYSVVAGGFNNVIDQHDYSWAGGINATVSHTGAFVWSDASGGTCPSNGDNTFTICAANGIYYKTGASQPTNLRARIFDVAEFMDAPRTSLLKAAELVSIAGNRMVDRSHGAYDEHLLGVVSGPKASSFFMGAQEAQHKGQHRVAVSLAGAVYTRVTGENGNIRIGDPITSSSTPGAGMKATVSGKIVGYAMENVDFRGKKIQEIAMFVSTGYFIQQAELVCLEQEIQELEQEVQKAQQ